MVESGVTGKVVIPNRDVTDIINKMFQIIPESETDLRGDLHSYYATLWNKAPEILSSYVSWKPLEKILNKNITAIDTDWKKKILQLFNNID